METFLLHFKYHLSLTFQTSCALIFIFCLVIFLYITSASFPLILFLQTRIQESSSILRISIRYNNRFIRRLASLTRCWHKEENRWTAEENYDKHWGLWRTDKCFLRLSSRFECSLSLMKYCVLSVHITDAALAVAVAVLCWCNVTLILYWCYSER